MKIKRFAKCALVGLMLSGAPSGPASAQSLGFASLPSVQELAFYGFVGASLVDFRYGGRENAITFGAGLLMSTALYSMPGLLWGVEVDNTSFTGSGSGWSIQRLRAVVATTLLADSALNATLSGLAGFGRIGYSGGPSETGLSLGVRLALALPVAGSFSAPGGLENVSLFLQHDRNMTGGSWETSTTSAGLLIKW